jgi:hypothetical protein
MIFVFLRSSVIIYRFAYLKNFFSEGSTIAPLVACAARMVASRVLIFYFASSENVALFFA